jgi:branched-chain amino acid transport system permease protein
LSWVIVSSLNGLSLGSILFLLTTGLSITLGLMGTVNLAHGALYMVGAYVGWTLAVKFGFNYWLAALAGGATAGLVGIIIERGFLSRLYGKPLAQALLTVGFVYVLTNLTQLIWGGAYRQPFTMPALAESFSFADFTYPLHRVATIVIGLIAFVVLWWFNERTRVGAVIRAGMSDRQMTTGLGINLRRINLLVFFLGAFITGFAGVIGSQTIVVHLDLGFDILLLALVVVVVGGTSSILGSFVGAMVIGIINSFGNVIIPDFSEFLMYLIMLVILLIRPSGLIPKNV